MQYGIKLKDKNELNKLDTSSYSQNANKSRTPGHPTPITSSSINTTSANMFKFAGPKDGESVALSASDLRSV